MKEINRIIIAETNGKYKIKGDLKRCYICGINFTAIQPCIICQIMIEKEKELGRKLTKEEFDKSMEWMRGVSKK